MLLKYEDLRNRLIGLVGPGQLAVTTRALEDAGQRISRYLLMQFIINGSYGLAAGLGLFFLGVPYAVLWGFLAAVLRYIPYVGPWIAAFSPSSSAWWRFRGGCSLHWSLACLCSWNWEQYGHGALALRPQYWGIGSGTAGRDRVLDLAVGTARARVGHTVDRLPRGAWPACVASALLRPAAR